MTKAGVSAGQCRSTFGSAGPAPAFCKPTLAEAAPLIFGVSAPDPGFLIGSKGVLQAVLFHRALGADDLRFGDGVDSRSGRADRKKQCRFGISAGRDLTPFGSYGKQVGNSSTRDCDVIHKNTTPGLGVRQGKVAWIYLEF